MITLTLTFTRPEGTSCRLEARSGSFVSPFPADTLYAVTCALEPTFDLSTATEAIIAALDAAELVPGDTLAVEVGDRLGEALCATPAIETALHTALTIAQEGNGLLDLRLFFGEDCGRAAALPWDVLRLRERFLVSDNIASLTRKRLEADWDQAIDMHERSLEASEQVGDVRAAAESSMRLGNLNRQTGKWERAIEVCRRGLEAFDHLGDARGVAQTNDVSGECIPAKRRVGTGNRVVRAEPGDEPAGWGCGWTGAGIQQLGRRPSAKGRLRAVEMYQQSLEVKEPVVDVQGVAHTRGSLETST